MREQEAAEAFVKVLPTHACGLYIEHNAHRDMYETVAEYMRNRDDHWVSEQERAAAEASNELWVLHWYPDTPIGCYVRAGSTLLSVLGPLVEP